VKLRGYRAQPCPGIGLALLISGLLVVLSGCGSDSGEPHPGADHVHGLGVNPHDGALYVATHGGLFRSEPGAESAEAVGSPQDVMGFTVVGPNRFLASGHPPPGEAPSPHLGLIASDDAGQSWREVSLGGQVDLHVIRAAADGRLIWAYDALRGELMISEDGGESWASLWSRAPLFDLAVDPGDPRRALGISDRGLLEIRTGSKDWDQVGPEVGFLAWPRARALYRVDAKGSAFVSRDRGQSWTRGGHIGGPPVALTTGDNNTLFVAREDGTVLESSDGGASWRTRVSP
jgi:photosystem II stability/assembly factor-like uncharacterized protein